MTIPIISLDEPNHDALVQAIRTACSDYGFFSVRNHGIAPEVIDNAFTQSKRFFSLPQEDKLALHINKSPCHRGFDPIGWQSLDLSKQGQASAADLKESFYIGTEPEVNATKPVSNHGPNQWPSDKQLPGFQIDVDTYRREASQLAYRLMRLIAESLNLPSSAFDAMMRHPTCTTRLLFYPPQPATNKEQIGSGAHTDWGGITVLAQDDAGGLEVRLPSGDWVGVTPEPNVLVINTGDLMQRWTNNRYRSSWHRVINRHSGRARYSIAYFFDLDHHAVIETLPSCIDEDHPPLYPPITAGEHILEMYRKTTV